MVVLMVLIAGAFGCYNLYHWDFELATLWFFVGWSLFVGAFNYYRTEMNEHFK